MCLNYHQANNHTNKKNVWMQHLSVSYLVHSLNYNTCDFVCLLYFCPTFQLKSRIKCVSCMMCQLHTGNQLPYHSDHKFIGFVVCNNCLRPVWLMENFKLKAATTSAPRAQIGWTCPQILRHNVEGLSAAKQSLTEVLSSQPSVDVNSLQETASTLSMKTLAINGFPTWANHPCVLGHSWSTSFIINKLLL